MKDSFWVGKLAVQMDLVQEQWMVELLAKLLGTKQVGLKDHCLAGLKVLKLVDWSDEY
jgi:hypothetical protein